MNRNQVCSTRRRCSSSWFLLQEHRLPSFTEAELQDLLSSHYESSGGLSRGAAAEPLLASRGPQSNGVFTPRHQVHHKRSFHKRRSVHLDTSFTIEAEFTASSSFSRNFSSAHLLQPKPAPLNTCSSLHLRRRITKTRTNFGLGSFPSAVGTLINILKLDELLSVSSSKHPDPPASQKRAAAALQPCFGFMLCFKLYFMNYYIMYSSIIMYGIYFSLTPPVRPPRLRRT